ncbi:MAG: hypothetical protein ACYTGL_26795, partial [Planctomycetota bacterium]
MRQRTLMKADNDPVVRDETLDETAAEHPTSESTRDGALDHQRGRNEAHSTGAPGGSVDSYPEIPGFRFVRVLGKGAFGCVYLAVDTVLNRHVAIKVPHPGKFKGEAAVQMYLDEARTLASL